MRIAYFAHFAGGTDASSATDADLLEALRARGVDVVTLSPYGRRTGWPGGSVAAGRLPRLLLAVPGYLRMLVRGLRAATDPDARIVSQYHVFHAATLVAFLVARMRGRPLVVRAHNLLPLSYRSRIEAGVNRALFTLYRRILRHRATWLLVSGMDWKRRAEGMGLDPPRVHVLRDNVTPVPEPSPDELRSLRQALGIGDVRTVLKAGSFTRDGTSVFTDALRRLGRADTIGIVVGDSEWGDAFRREAGASGVADRLLVLGPRSNAEVRRLMALADVCVGLLTDHPMARGSLPRNTLEAMAAGRPVVACRGVIDPDLVEDGRNCLLVPPGDGAGLAAAIARILDDPPLAARLGSEARRTIAERFRSDVIAAELEALLRRMPGRAP